MEGENFERFSQKLSEASKSLHRLKTRYMSKYGLTSTHTYCLRQMYGNPEGLTKSEIADNCDIDKAQITRVVNELIAKGYAASDEKTGAYNRKFFLTEKGRAIADEINDIVIRVVDYVSGDIPKAEIESFYAIFERINNKLKDSEEYFKKGF